MWTLKRTISCFYGTFGTLLKNGVPFCITLEPKIPIILPGVYGLYIANSPKRLLDNNPDNDFCYWFHNVPGHEAVQIHAGCLLKDTLGCILVGDGYYDYEGVGGLGLHNSLITLNKLLKEDIKTLTVE